MFGDRKKNEKSRKKVYDSDLVELQVWITSADPECDGYPSLQTDESCELLFPFRLCDIHSAVTSEISNPKNDRQIQ